MVLDSSPYVTVMTAFAIGNSSSTTNLPVTVVVLPTVTGVVAVMVIVVFILSTVISSNITSSSG